jgi:hypothetical protein
MLTDADERPRVNALPPHIRPSKDAHVRRSTMPIGQSSGRPSLMQAIEYDGEF